MSTDESRRTGLADDARSADGPELSAEIGGAGDVLAACESDSISIVAAVGPDADREAVESAVRTLRDELAYHVSGGIDD